jgi:hypothetical protein
MTFERLIRFVDDQGQTRYGDVPQSVDIDHIVGQKVKVLKGSPSTTLSLTQEQATVKEVSLYQLITTCLRIPSKLMHARLVSFYALSNPSISFNASV